MTTAAFSLSQFLTTPPISCCIYYAKTTALGRMVGNSRLENARKAYQAVCEMLQFTGLSAQSECQLQNLKRLLEIEITAANSEFEETKDEEAAD